MAAKKRILAAVEEKIAGKEIVAPEHVHAPSSGAQVLDLVAAMHVSLQKVSSPAPSEASKNAKPALGERKPVKRAPTKAAGEPAPAKGRAGKR